MSISINQAAPIGGAQEILDTSGDAVLITPAQAALALGISVGTLAVWRCTSRYPLSYVKIGRSVKYRVGDIRKFLNQNTH